MESKILFILHLPPPIHGAAMMGKYMEESKLINSSFDCYCINLATAEDLSDIGRFGLKKAGKFLSLLRHIRLAVKNIRPDLVYITPNACGNAFFKDFIVVQMLKAMGCRVIAHYHNKGVATCQYKWLYNFLYKRFFKNLKVILLAEALYRDVAQYVNRKDVYICPNGIPESLTEEPEARRGNRVTQLLFLSNLLISKGVFVLLDALEIVKEKGYDFVCQLVGGETSEINAARLAEEVEKRDLKDRVVYVGRKVGKEKDTFLRQADIFVFPTYYHNECFPLVLLEAMEYRLPVVSTHEGGIADIVEDGGTGLICERQNAGSLAGCIIRLLDDEVLRIRMGNAGYEKFHREFTLEKFEYRMTDIFHQNLLSS